MHIFDKIRFVLLHRYAILKRKKEVAAERDYEERRVINDLDQQSFVAKLSKKEIKAVIATWGQIHDLSISTFKEYELFKSICGFDCRFLSHQIYLPIVARLLNDYKITQLLEHKSLLGYLVPGLLRTPKCYIRVFNHEFYDDKMHQISVEEAVDICGTLDEFVIKDSSSTSGGESFKIVSLFGKSKIEKKAFLKDFFQSKTKDIVIQERLKQHHSMIKYNSSSINTLRITTLYLNGVCNCLSVILRMGQQGMTVDNCGAGGILVGVSENGELSEVGYDNHLNRFYGVNGVVFKNQKIDQLPKIIAMVIENHVNQYSLCKLIGWDICIDVNNEPVVVEINSSQPGIFFEQICTGPIFGNRTQEVIDYCNSRDFFYNRALARY